MPRKKSPRGHRPKLADEVKTYQIVLPKNLYEACKEVGPDRVREILDGNLGLF